MPIEIPCSNPNCRQPLACPDELAGQQIQCPKCGVHSQVPANEKTEQPKSQTAPSTRKLGQYTLVRKLGEGGFGTVYEAVQEGIDRTVALKVLPRRLMTDQTYLERFKREAKAAAQLSHVNIVSVYDIGEDQGYHFFSMQFIDGESLAQRQMREGKIPVDESLVLIRSVAAALAYAWDHGKIVHRDIKPDNILIARDGLVKIVDLGLAKSTEDKQSVTVTGAGIGSPAYMAPEQGRGMRDVDCRADIYSLGITLFHMVCGEPPYKGETPLAVMMAHVEDDFPDPRSVNPDVPDNLCGLLEKMCAKDPEKRYLAPHELLGEIDRVISGEFPSKPQSRSAAVKSFADHEDDYEEEAGEKPLVKTLLFIAIGAGIALIVGTALSILTPDKPDRPSITRDTSEPSRRGSTTAMTTAAARPPTPTATTALPDTETLAAPTDPGKTDGQESELQGDEEAQPIKTPKELLELADKFAEENGGQFEDVILNYRKVLEVGEETSFGKKAQEQVTAWTRKLLAVANGEFEKREKEADKHFKSGRFTDAFKLWDEFSEQLQTETVSASIEKKIEEIRSKVDEIGAKFETDTKALMAKRPGELTASEAGVLKRVGAKASAPHQLTSDVRRESLAQLSEKISNLLENHERIVAAERMKNYKLFWKRYHRFMKLKRFDEAAQLAARSRPKSGDKELVRLENDAKLLAAVFKNVEDKLNSLVGSNVRFGGASMRVSAVRSGKIYSKQGGVELAFGPEKLDGRKLLELGLGGETDPAQKAYQNFLFQYYYGTSSRLGKAIKEAAAIGADISLYESTLVPMLVIVSSPSGANLKIEPPIAGLKEKLVTPLRIQAKKETSYKIEFSKEDYKSAMEELKVGISGEHQVSVRLKKDSWLQSKNILVWRLYADHEEEFVRTVDFLKEGLGNRWRIIDDFSDQFDRSFKQKLSKCRALLIPEMGRIRTPSIASQLKPIASAYVRRGGNIVFCGIHRGQEEFLKDAGVLDVQSVGRSVGISVPFTIAGRRFSTGVGKSFITTRSTYIYRIRSGDRTTSFAKTANGSAIVARKVGSGWIILLGMDYFKDNPKTRQILINAVTYR